jgi:phosphate ABC transporter permease protein PstC
MSVDAQVIDSRAVVAPRELKQIDLSVGRRQTSERAAEIILLCATVLSVLTVVLVAVFVLEQGIPALAENGIGFLTGTGWDADLENAWSVPEGATFGALPLIAGTVLTTLGALAITTVIGLGCSIALVEFCPGWLRRPIEAVVQLLAGIPSVVFGLVGFSLMVPFIGTYVVPVNSFEEVPDAVFDGQALLTAVIVLTFMIMPFFVSVTSDALRAVPRSLIDGGRALGLTQWRAVTKIQLPLALPGIIAGAVLASARAMGEAIALSMVAGALAVVPTLENGPLYFVLTPVRTMASAIVETGGEAGSVPSIQGALFALATLLLISSLILSVAARFAFAWSAKRMRLAPERAV